jgi:hypothetical protein
MRKTEGKRATTKQSLTSAREKTFRTFRTNCEKTELIIDTRTKITERVRR